MKKFLISILITSLLVLPLVTTACSESNSAPNTPSIPLPGDDTTGTSIYTTLNWTGGDPDGNTVTYDIYFGTSETLTDPVATDQSASTYDPGTLNYSTHYYWKIVVTDEHGLSTEGPLWEFTTASTSSNRIAILETGKGTIKFELYEEKAPITAANFINLANEGFYDGLIFHRVIDDFMIQGGDPNGDGSGGSEYTIPLETSDDLKHVDGAVSMARRSDDPNSASSQFFICDGGPSHLDGVHAVFGQVIEGMDVVRAIAAVATDSNNKPLVGVKMTTVTITEQ